MESQLLKATKSKFLKNIYFHESLLHNTSSYKVYNVTPTVDSEVQTLYSFEDNLNLDFWDGLVLSKSSRIMVPPFSRMVFENLLKVLKLDFDVMIEDVEEIFEKERVNMKLNAERLQSRNGFDFEHFWSLQEFEKYSDYLAENFPKLVKKEIIGESAEGRKIIALKISRNEEFGKNPVIFMESGVHAR